MAANFYGRKKRNLPEDISPEVWQTGREPVLQGRQEVRSPIGQQADGGTSKAQTPEAEPGAEAAQPEQDIITEDDVRRAWQTLRDYRDAKDSLTQRLLEDEKWWTLRHWEVIRHKKDSDSPDPASAWLFNSICNKHADAMDNYPEAHVLPREQADEQEAQKLSSIIPCIMDLIGFEQTYSDGWWEKLKHGTAPYFVGWDPQAENGLGEHDIHLLDLLNLYWEPGIRDIQDSRNFFTVELADLDVLEQQFPQFKGRFKPPVANDFYYTYDNNVKLEDKALIVNWYHKAVNSSGKTVVHYVKFAGDSCILYSSQNDTDDAGEHIYAERGYYDHGEYPVVFDTLWPEKGTPVGFGLIAIMKSPQLYIDKLGGNILEHSYLSTRPRYITAQDSGINEQEFKDTSRPIVHSELSLLDDQHIRPIEVPNLDGNCVSVLQMKIDELKETSSNRDFSNGSTASGVTAAAAISALQEAGNKVSRDANQGGYRAYREMVRMVIENIRQFYTETRCFRITGQDGSNQFVDYDNSGIQEQEAGRMEDGTQLLRRPDFDLKIKAQKRSPFSIEAQYERAKELYQLGFFNPENAQQSMIALKMMEFEGKDQIQEEILKGQTLYNQVQQLQLQLAVYQAAAQQIPQPQTGQAGQSAGGQLHSGGQTIAQKQQSAAEKSRQTPYQRYAVSNARVGGQS